MLDEKQQRLLNHFLLRDKCLMPKLNDFGRRLFQTGGFSWLRTTDFTGISRGRAFKLYDVREASTDATQAIKSCVVVSYEKDTLVYQVEGSSQEITIHKHTDESNDYLIKFL